MFKRFFSFFVDSKPGSNIDQERLEGEEDVPKIDRPKIEDKEDDNKEFDKDDGEDEKKIEPLDIQDFKCPICIDILIQPIITSCNHELCLECFRDLKKKGSRRGKRKWEYECPLCRAQINGEEISDTDRWTIIQSNFADDIKNKIGEMPSKKKRKNESPMTNRKRQRR